MKLKVRNRNHTWKHAISDRKFSRLFDSNLDKAGHCYVTLSKLNSRHPKYWEIQRSLAAVRIGEFVYAKFETKNSNKDRLETFCIRYKFEDGFTPDFLAWAPFPIYVF